VTVLVVLAKCNNGKQQQKYKEQTFHI